MRGHILIEEPARQKLLYGEYEVVVLGGGPCRDRRGGLSRARRAKDVSDRALRRVSRRHGHRRRWHKFLRACMVSSMARFARLVQGMASELLARIDRLNGLNTPHPILGKVFAQAYDTAAYKDRGGPTAGEPQGAHPVPRARRRRGDGR